MRIPVPPPVKSTRQSLCATPSARTSQPARSVVTGALVASARREKSRKVRLVPRLAPPKLRPRPGSLSRIASRVDTVPTQGPLASLHCWRATRRRPTIGHAPVTGAMRIGSNCGKPLARPGRQTQRAHIRPDVCSRALYCRRETRDSRPAKRARPEMFAGRRRASGRLCACQRMQSRRPAGLPLTHRGWCHGRPADGPMRSRDGRGTERERGSRRRLPGDTPAQIGRKTRHRKTNGYLGVGRPDFSCRYTLRR